MALSTTAGIGSSVPRWYSHTKCVDLSADGEDCVGPRTDPYLEERDNAIWMWMYSSVMDYAGEASQDMLGLGAYDFAAARAFYGDIVSVYKILHLNWFRHQS